MCLIVTATNASHHYGCRGTPSDCGRGDQGGTSYSRAWGRLLGLLLQLIEVVSVDNIHLEQLLLLATQQSLHNILLGGHLHPRHKSVYGVTVLPRQFRHTAVYCKDIVIVVEWNENYKDEDSEGFLNCAWQAGPRLEEAEEQWRAVLWLRPSMTSRRMVWLLLSG